MVKCLPDLSIFAVFLKNKNIIFKIRRSKVTDYAALKERICSQGEQILSFKSISLWYVKSLLKSHIKYKTILFPKL